jgi:hypothetical protein
MVSVLILTAVVICFFQVPLQLDFGDQPFPLYFFDVRLSESAKPPLDLIAQRADKRPLVDNLHTKMR